MLVKLNAHQESAIGASLNSQAPRTRDAARNQILCNGCKIIINDLPMGLQSCLMPCGAELASTTDIGQYKYPSFFHPKLSGGSQVKGGPRYLKAAVGGENGRVAPIKLHVLRVNHEVRDLGSVL